MFGKVAKKMVNLKRLSASIEWNNKLCCKNILRYLDSGIHLDFLELIVKSETQVPLSEILEKRFTEKCSESILRFKSCSLFQDSASTNLKFDVELNGFEGLPARYKYYKKTSH